MCGNLAYIVKIRATLLRDTGATISPFNSFLLLQGLETLSLRVERHVQNALRVVEYLAAHPQVRKVNHPSLPEHPNHGLYRKYYPNGGGSIFTFEVKGGAGGITPSTVRLSIGTEHIDDIIEDLEHGFRAIL